MPRKDSEQYREYQRDLMRRLRAEKKSQVKPSQPGETITRLTSGRESISDTAAQPFIYMETNLGETKITPSTPQAQFAMFVQLLQAQYGDITINQLLEKLKSDMGNKRLSEFTGKK